MRSTFISISILFISFCLSITSEKYSHSDEFPFLNVRPNSVCTITEMYDLKGDTILLPVNCTLLFKNKGGIINGVLIGESVKIRYQNPFIGDSIYIYGCEIVGKKLIRDIDVFISVAHTQQEIQTLFDISNGIKILFSQGTYKNIERIEINNNVEADFSNSTIMLNCDSVHVGECFYMDPWVDKGIDYCRIRNLRIIGQRYGFKGSRDSRRCIQLFHVSEVVLDNISIDKFYGGPNYFRKDSKDLLDKTRIGTCAIAIMKYDKCTINNCFTNDISKEVFWCVPNTNPHNITYFTNNKSFCSHESGSASFFTLIDGRCFVDNNEVYNYNGSAFNTFCYDSEICNNKFYDGKRSVAIDLSEGTMYRASNVRVHDNECINTKGLLSAYGEDIVICNNTWINDTKQSGKRFSIITINTRNERVVDGPYIGSNNNPQQDSSSKNIIVSDNVCVNGSSDIGVEICCACLSGNYLSFLNNKMVGFNMPVVQMIDGNEFKYMYNLITDSRKGNYAELYIKKGTNITITNNSFFQNNTYRSMNCTVQAKKIGGSLCYGNNSVALISKGREYVPFHINDYTELSVAEIYVDGVSRDIRINSGIRPERVRLKTNIK